MTSPRAVTLTRSTALTRALSIAVALSTALAIIAAPAAADDASTAPPADDRRIAEVPAPADDAIVDATADAPPAAQRSIDGGLHATGRIRSAEPGPSIAVALGSGYGYTEAVLDANDAHHRVGGVAAIAVRAAHWLELGGELRGRYDKHTGAMPDDGFVGDPRLWALVRGAAGDGRWLGLRLGVWMPGADAPSIEPDAITADASLLFTLAGPRQSLTLTAGYRLDRSSASVDADRLSPNDRLALGISEADAVLLGIRGAHRAGPWTMFGELSWDLLLGDAAPSALESPLRAGAGFRRALDDSIALEALLEVSASSRPAADDTSTLVAIEPRASALVGLTWQPRPPPAPPRRAPDVVVAPPPPDEPPPPPPPPTTGSVRGRILDSDGAPLPGATIRAGDKTATTGDDGTFTLTDLTPGAIELSIERSGHEPLTRTVTVTAGTDAALDVNLARTKLPSQIRGVIRDFGGKGLPATIRIDPLGLTITAAPDGTFSVDVPPGTYTLVISHPGYTPQEKKNVSVEEEEVASRNVELRKARR